MSPTRSAAFDASPVATILFSVQGEVRAVNDEARRLVGVGGAPEDEAAVGRHWSEAFSDLEGTEFGRAFEEAADGAVGDEIRAPAVELAGVYARAVLVRLADDGVAGYFLPHEDIREVWEQTRRVREQEVVLQDLETFRRHYPFGSVAIFDDDLRYLSVSGRGWHELEIDPATLEGRTLRQCWEEATAESLEALARVALGGEETVGRVEYDDQVYEIWAGPLPAGLDGEARGMFVSRDATEATEREQRIRLLENATAAANVGITLADLRQPDEPLTYVSDGFTRVTGYSPEEALGRNCRFLQGEATDPMVVESIREAIDDREPFQGALLNYRKNGEPFWNRLSLAPFAVDGGETTHYVGIQEDVTEIRSTQMERDHQRRLAELGTLAGGIAHDFNNVLMEIQGRLALAAATDSLEEVRSEADGIRDATRRGTALVSQLLAYSRRQTSTAESHQARSSLVRELITPVVRLLPRNIRVTFDEPPEPVHVALRAVRLEQVLLNLAKNAAEAMPDGGHLRIAVEMEEPGEWARLTVADDGTGMSPEVLEQAWDPFFTTKGSGGTGLGLQTVARIVERAGGSVQVESEVGEGTTFTLRLPIGEAPPSAEQTRPAARRRAESLEGLRILVAEDQAGIRHVLERLLERRGLEVVAVADGGAAREAITGEGPGFDIILADRDMPNLTGDRLLRTVAESTTPENRPWLALMSGELPTHLEVPSGTILIPKPFEVAELLSILEEAVTGAPSGPAS
jgi:PAS domain S-box-containing protein